MTSDARSLLAIKPIVWGEHRKPCEACRYDHILGEGPLGDYRIEWCSWKDMREPGDAGAVLFLGDDYESSATCVENAKREAEAHLRCMVEGCIEAPAPGSARSILASLTDEEAEAVVQLATAADRFLRRHGCKPSPAARSAIAKLRGEKP